MVLKKLKRIKTQTILFLLTLFIMPTSIIAYSDYIIPGGENIGIELNSKGIIIVGLYKVNGDYPGIKADLKVGDIIKAVDGKYVGTVTQLAQIINTSQESVKITYIRDNKELETNLNLSKDDNGVCKTGLYVKDSINGIGTLSFIDPKTKLFGALGHEIIDKTSGKILEIKDGKIYNSNVTSIERSENGIPGEKNANYDSNSVTGKVKENTTQGIFGNYTDSLPNKKQYKVAKPDEIKIGKAKLLTVLSENDIKEYEIEIIKINHNMSQKTKNIQFKVTDKTLLEKTGGIVQGMSGSPIIQDDKIIGVVTHVFINDPTHGYGIFITNMLEEAEN